MKSVKANLFAVPIRVVRNTKPTSKNAQWAQIIHEHTGAVRHTGQLDYIRRIAKEKYNVSVNL